jgi:sulfur-oxidizing protein SoxY
VISRRTFAWILGLLPGAGWARAERRDPEAVRRELIGARDVVFEGVAVDMPQLAETGNSVPITVEVESPMTEADHVRRIRIVATGNPEPLAATFHLGPVNGVARISTRLRLARTQNVLVLAEHSTGRVTGAEVSVLVTLGACIDERWTD